MIKNNTLDKKSILEEIIAPTICLNMIVKNESKVIIRLLESVLPIIDTYCICDTGSTDNTKELIINFFDINNISGKWIEEPFQNFEYNRNFSLNSCQGLSDFILLLDADMILKINNFDKNKLKFGDFFQILQGNENFYYQNTRIIKNNGLFFYSGVTHEYINIPPGSKIVKIDKKELFIIDIGDGGAKGDKYERDIQLLLKGIEESNEKPGKPNFERYHFYLANSYYDCGIYEKAIEIYRKRIDIGGWDQEIFYSYYRIGLCFKFLNKMENAIFEWMNAFSKCPTRVENLYEIIHYYRNKGDNILANIYYQIAINILKQKLDKESYLFLHNDIYTFKLYYEYTVFAFYLNIKNINDEIVEILNNSNDYCINNNLMNNLKFYKNFLTPKIVHNFTNNIIYSLNEESISFNSSSSCLIENNEKNGYLMNIRYVNYFINNKGNYLNCEKHISTINKYIELDKCFNILKEKVFDLEFTNKQYLGVEDVRIFRDINTNQIIFTGTGLHENGTIGIMFGNYSKDYSNLNSKELKCSFRNAECEKNWVFVNYKKETHMIYSWNPLKIGKINNEKNYLELVDEKKMPNLFSHVRGSSCGFKYNKIMKGVIEDLEITIEKDELWFILHIVSYEQPRFYYHLIAVFDENLNLLRYSAPFKFGETCIEYSLSILVEHERVLINYSEWDRTTKIAEFDKKYIDSILIYKP
jgi:tetratricopeptide (TPR) repeat protein